MQYDGCCLCGEENIVMKRECLAIFFVCLLLRIHQVPTKEMVIFFILSNPTHYLASHISSDICDSVRSGNYG